MMENPTRLNAKASVQPSSATEAMAKFYENGKQYVNNLLAETSPFKIVAATCIASIGIGTAAYMFGRRSSKSQPDDSKRKKKSQTTRNRMKKSSKLDTSDNSGQEQSLEDIRRPVTGLSQAIFPKRQDPNEDVVPSTFPANKVINVQEGKDVLVLKQVPRGRKTPCIVPFALKLETFLRVHKIKYQLEEDKEPRFQDSPWIRLNTEDITESQNVLQFLISSFDLKSEWNLAPEQEALSTAYTHLLENHLYWAIALWRWVYDGAKSLKEIQLLPKETRALIPDVCQTVEQAAWFHGIGKLSPEEVKVAVLKDLRSLSELLGTKNFFLGTPTPTELDCTAFGMLAQFLWNMSGPWHDAMEKDFANLTNFCWRIRTTYWKDWNECVNNTKHLDNETYPNAETVL